MQPVLLRVLTDLFVSRADHPRDEIGRYETIALGLIDKTDAPTLAIVAAKLANFGATPAAVVDKLIERGGAGAQEVLRRSTLVDPARLLALAEAGETTLAVAVAARLDLDEAIATALARRPESEIARALIANPVSPLPQAAQQALVAGARRDGDLARALCRRLPDAATIAPLFLYASSSQRAAIIRVLRREELVDPMRPRRRFVEEMTGAEIERAAVAGDKPLLAALVSRALGATLSEATTIIDDPHGEPMAVALAALRVPVDAAARIFMSLDPAIAHSHARVRMLSELAIDLAPGLARRLVEAMIGNAAEPRRAAYVPASDHRAAATPSRAATTDRDDLSRRPNKGLFVFRRPA